MSNKTVHSKMRVCRVCGEMFHPRTVTQQCCSAYCGRKYVQRARNQKYQDMVQTCDWCGNEFTPRIPFQRFCRVGCGQAAYRQRTQAIKAGQEPLVLRKRPKTDRINTHNKRDIQELRAREGLRPLSSGRVICLSCGNSFASWDRVLNKICPNCKDNEEFINGEWF